MPTYRSPQPLSRSPRGRDLAFAATLVVQAAVVVLAALLLVVAVHLPACPAKEPVHARP